MIVYFAPGCNTLLSEMDGPPVPLELVVVSRLYEPAYAAALVATGVVAPKNETHPSAVPSSKLKVSTVCASARHAHENAMISQQRKRLTRFRDTRLLIRTKESMAAAPWLSALILKAPALA